MAEGNFFDWLLGLWHFIKDEKEKLKNREIALAFTHLETAMLIIKDRFKHKKEDFELLEKDKEQTKFLNVYAHPFYYYSIIMSANEMSSCPNDKSFSGMVFNGMVLGAAQVDLYKSSLYYKLSLNQN